MAKNWKRAAGILWPVLVKAAKNKETLEYGEDIAPILGYDPKTQAQPVRYALGPIQDFCVEHKLPRLTTLVVDREGDHGSGFLGGSLDDVYEFDWGYIGNPFGDVGLDEFVEFVDELKGKTLNTLSQNKPFLFNVYERYVSFTPSTGSERPLYWHEVQMYLNIFNEGGRKTTDFEMVAGKKLVNASYFLAIMAEYSKPQNINRTENEIVKAKQTERETATKSRIGQVQFRNGLLAYWEGGCAVTSIRNKDLLRASHIKPWKDSDDRERLDKYNGLLLSPDLDALFDCGLITFDDNREMRISPTIEKSELKKLGVDGKMRLRQIEDEHKAYLKYHRDHIFQGKVK